MATSVLRPPSVRVPRCFTASNSFKSAKCTTLSFTCTHRQQPWRTLQTHRLLQLVVPLASQEEAIQTDNIQAESDAAAAADVEDGASEVEDTDPVEPDSPILALLESYKEALATDNQSEVAEIMAFLKSFEDEKLALEEKLDILSAELSYAKDRVLRISADFDNFRKRTDRERLSLVENAQGEVSEKLLPVLDNFERAKAQIKVETEGEEKISNSYQSIYKQFVEVLGSLGVVPVETIGNQFDPLLHEAIMREDSSEYEEGIVIQEFRKGFKLGDRLLRPSMVKVSAGPGPTKPELEDEPVGVGVTNEDVTEEEDDSVSADDL